ncbi:MAG: polysaccharide biosynthesis tyrosine autokinase [Hyphomonadaceae bacterium]
MNVIAIRQPGSEINLPPPEEGGELGTISLKWFLTFLVRRWMLIVATGAVVFVACFLAFLFQRPQYSAVAMLMMSAGQENVLGQDQMLVNGQAVPNQQIIDSQLEVLRSRMLSGRLVDDLGLINDPEWNSEIIEAEAGAAPPATQPVFSEQVRQDVIDAVNKAITVNRRGMTLAAEITVTSASAERAAQMANRLVELFQQYQMEARIESSTRNNEWLLARLATLREDVQAKEEATEQFRAANGLLSSEGALLSEQEMTAMQASLMQARADLADKEARYTQLQSLINSGGSPDTIAAVLNSVAITQLRAQEATSARQLADLESRYGEGHPALANARAELQDVRNQINSEIARIAASLRNDAEISRARVNSLQASIDEARGQMVGSNEQMVRLRELEREAAASRSVYEAFLQRYHQISDQGTMQSTPAQLLSNAAVPTRPSSPRLYLSFLISFGLAAILGLAAGFLAEALDDGFASSEDVERKTGSPALSSIPRLNRSDLRNTVASGQHPSAYLLERQMSAFTEAFRVLRTTILFAAGQAKTQVVAITSSLPNEGKTTVSLCLARVSALSGQKVLLIDCDLRRRSLKEVLDIEPPVGLLQVLSGEVGWRQAIYLDEASGMNVLPLSGSGFTPKEIFGAQDMSRLLDELRNHYDLIILDCAPVLAVAETRVAVAKADCAVVVARWQKTPMRAVRSTLQQLHDAGANIRGVALNGVDRRVPGYYSYPTYDFSKA